MVLLDGTGFVDLGVFLQLALERIEHQRDLSHCLLFGSAMADWDADWAFAAGFVRQMHSVEVLALVQAADLGV